MLAAALFALCPFARTVSVGHFRLRDASGADAGGVLAPTVLPEDVSTVLRHVRPRLHAMGAGLEVVRLRRRGVRVRARGKLSDPRLMQG